MSHRTVLVLGATGYVGGRLIPELLRDGHHVRAVARSPKKLENRPWSSEVETFEGDLLEADTLTDPFAGVLGDSDSVGTRSRVAGSSPFQCRPHTA